MGHTLPRLRPVEIRPVVQDGLPALLLRDPLGLGDSAIIIPRRLAPVLGLLDGTRDTNGVRASLAVRYGSVVDNDTLHRLIAALDEAFLLEGERFDEAIARSLLEYHQLPHRVPCCAGASYPADADTLRHTLDSLSAGVVEGAESTAVRGLVSPHIDYDRGGETYARVWKRAASAAEAADLVILLGTDHFSEGHRLTLTRQHYGSPLGLLPTDSGVVDQLADAIGPETAFGAELHHRREHSIELAAVWLQHARKGKPCRVVPVLCGSFDDLDGANNLLEQLACVAAFIDTCRAIVAERQALVVAAGDLAHVGPAFGGRPLQWIERARLQQADAMLLRHACAGDAQAFYREVQGSGNVRNVCGLPPIYYALRILEPAQGDLVSYQICPADEAGTSFVSIAGLVWT